MATNPINPSIPYQLSLPNLPRTKQETSDPDLYADLLALFKALRQVASQAGSGGGGISALTGDVTASGTGSVVATLVLALTHAWQRTQYVVPVVLTDAANITVDPTLGNNFLLLCTSAVGSTRNIKLDASKLQKGMVLNFEIIQPHTGGPCNVVFLTTGSPVVRWGLGGQASQPAGSQVADASDFYSGYVQNNFDFHAIVIGQSGSPGAGYGGSSNTSQATVGTGSVTFTTQAGFAYLAGARIRATSVSTGEFMEGIVSNYLGTTLVVTMDLNSGTGTHTDWNFNLAGQRGTIGLPGSPGSSNFAGTSTTSTTIGTGSLTFITQASLAYQVGARVRASSSASPANYIEGICTAYAGTSITINSDTIGGTGTFASWNLNIAGNPGVAGGAGPAFRVQLITTNQTIPAATATKIAYNAAKFDTAGAVSGGTFTCPAGGAGYYQVNAGALIPTSSYGYITINVNGTIVTEGTYYPPNGGLIGAIVADIIKLAVGDTLDVWANSSGTTIDADATATYFSAVWIRA